MLKPIAIGILVGSLLASCTEKSVGPTVSSQPIALAIPCDARRVLVTVCQQCHSDPTRNSAPFPLVTYADTQVVISGEPIWHFMRTFVQSGVMPLPPVRISTTDRDTLLSWLNTGAPPRSASDTCDAIIDLPDGGIDLQSTAPDSGIEWDGGDSEAANIDGGTVGDLEVDSSPEADTPEGDANVEAPAPEAGTAPSN